MFTIPKKPVGEPRIRKQYTREFKEEAVRQAVAGDRPVNEVAWNLGLRPAVLRDWMRVPRNARRPDRHALRMRFAFNRAHATQDRITSMCRVLQVSKAGYYTWEKRAPSSRTRETQALLTQITVMHRASQRRWRVSPENPWATREQARAARIDYLERWYNRCRQHSPLGYRTPHEHAQQLGRS